MKRAHSNEGAEGRRRMLPPLGALSLSAHDDVPTGVRDAKPVPRQGMTLLDGILKSQAGVTKVVNRARPGGKRADYASDGPIRRTINPDDDVCPDCPEGENRDLYIDRYDHVKKCNQCGLELGKFASEKAEKRNFADDNVDALG